MSDAAQGNLSAEEINAEIERRRGLERRAAESAPEYAPAGRERRAAAIDRRASANSEFFTFEAAGEVLALPASGVREVVPLDEMVPVPGAPGWIRGLIALRGAVVPVIDLPRKLGFVPPGERRRKLVSGEGDLGVIVSSEGCTKCLMIDDLGEVIEVADWLLTKAPPGLDVQLRQHLKMIAKRERGLLMILDPASLARA